MASFKANLSNLKVRAKGLAPACHLKFLIRYQITPDLISDQIYLIISNYCHIECLQLLYTFGRPALAATMMTRFKSHPAVRYMYLYLVPGTYKQRLFNCSTTSMIHGMYLAASSTAWKSVNKSNQGSESVVNTVKFPAKQGACRSCTIMGKILHTLSFLTMLPTTCH